MLISSRFLRGGLALGITLGASFVAAPEAHACGGLFCSSPSLPVSQRAERIVFSRDDAGNVTAIVEIQYEGPAQEFAWLLPVAGSPEVGVSSTAALQRLQAATNPSYFMTTVFEGQCADTFRGPSFSGGGVDAGASARDAGAALDGGSPVTVVSAGAVGPYDYVVISVDPAATPRSEVAFAWLMANGYYVQEAGAALYEPYLEGGMNLLAFRLTKGNDVGSIRPVRIGFGNGLATVPIRPTAVAATDDMGMLIWVLGPSRAIPVNYRALELNDALINWFNPSSTYGDVVTAAANQAGGQGFVTEMAGDAAPLATTIWQDFEDQPFQSVRAQSWSGREGELLATLLTYTGYGTLDGTADVLSAQLPLPDGVTTSDLLSCVSCYYPADTADIAGFDPATFLDAFEEQVIQPMRDTRDLFAGASDVTRFYTTMSASEMTMDPSFDFNADLPDVSSVHTATRTIECSPSVTTFEAPWRVALPSGATVRGTGSSWPFDATSGLPANARILRVGTSGTGDVVIDNTQTISAALTVHNREFPPPRTAGGGGGCTASPGTAPRGVAALVVALGAILALRRRRR